MRVLKCSGVLMGLLRGCGAQKTAHLNTFVPSHFIAYSCIIVIKFSKPTFHFTHFAIRPDFAGK